MNYLDLIVATWVLELGIITMLVVLSPAVITNHSELSSRPDRLTSVMRGAGAVSNDTRTLAIDKFGAGSLIWERRGYNREQAKNTTTRVSSL